MSIVGLSCVVIYVMLAIMIVYFFLNKIDSSHRKYSFQPTGIWYANNFGSLLFVKTTCMLFPDVLFINVLLTLLPIVANWLLWKKILWLSHVTSMATHWILNFIEQFQLRGCYFFKTGSSIKCDWWSEFQIISWSIWVVAELWIHWPCSQKKTGMDDSGRALVDLWIGGTPGNCSRLRQTYSDQKCFFCARWCFFSDLLIFQWRYIT